MGIDTEPRMRALFVGGLHSTPDEYPELAAMLEKKNFTFEPVEHDLINPERDGVTEALYESIGQGEKYIMIGHSLGAIAVLLAAKQLYKSHEYHDNPEQAGIPPMPQGVVLLSPAPLVGEHIRHMFSNLHAWRYTLTAAEMESIPREVLARLEEERIPRTLGGVVTQIYVGIDHETPFNMLVAGALATIEDAELYPIPMAGHKPNIPEYLRSVARHIGHLRVPEHAPNYRWPVGDLRGYSFNALQPTTLVEDRYTVGLNHHT